MSASLPGRLGLLNIVCRKPPLRDGPRYFDALLSNVSQVLDFDNITLFRPQTIGGFERSSRSIQGCSSVTNN
jgi:hypothetical protein